MKPVARPIKVSAMLRIALHVVIGTVAGFALGILAPIALVDCRTRGGRHAMPPQPAG